MIGSFAKSKAGRDKEEIYVIIDEEAEYVYLADGKYKTINKPKRKKKKHIQPIKKYDDTLLCKKLAAGIPVTDVEIKKAIKDINNNFSN